MSLQGSIGKLNLSKAEMMKLYPTERDRYVRDLINYVLSDGKEWTVREIAKKTDLSRNTITKHLQDMRKEQAIISEEKSLGALRIVLYRKAGNLQNKTEIRKKFGGDNDYVFFTLDSDDDHSVCIQQRQKDDLDIEKVKGAITVDFDDFEQFLKELHSFGAKVIQK